MAHDRLRDAGPHRLKMSARSLALALGVSFSTIYGWAHSGVPSGPAERLAELSGVPADLIERHTVS